MLEVAFYEASWVVKVSIFHGGNKGWEDMSENWNNCCVFL